MHNHHGDIVTAVPAQALADQVRSQFTQISSRVIAELIPDMCSDRMARHNVPYAV
eukprot:CAMPEP_0172714028 /NCGR_PEP_ID=MMETSP1074-20121228/64497_1 /TAXON_ID=2916 /ORGANISM="Ceratium fusus, Strain PA161109" /LENGTH=54 /DNA_ID=CAMNT_0013538315 /DNA_START=91 /DNA_END=251 /DNA_ORIENTATION=+